MADGRRAHSQPNSVVRWKAPRKLGGQRTIANMVAEASIARRFRREPFKSESRRQKAKRFRFAPERSLREAGTGFLTGLVLACSLLLGGATRSGSLGDAVLQLISVPLLLVALGALSKHASSEWPKLPLAFAAAVMCLPAIQLLPLPYGIWTRLPEREIIIETYALTDQAAPMLPMTMTPEATWLSGLSLLPPLAIFLGVLAADTRTRRNLIRVVIALGICSAFLGLLQIAQGPSSALRFYEVTNRTEAVGFFANRNHFAALLYVSMLFVSAFLVDAVMAAGRETHRRRFDFNSTVPVILWATALAILLAGELMARSRAGLALTVVALLAAFALGVNDDRLKARRSSYSKAIMATIFIAFLSFAPLALYRIFDRFDSGLATNLRFSFATKTIDAAISFMPLGSGLGSFVPVYQLFEQTSDLDSLYANHAHNDLLETWLEAGLVGVSLIALFVAWLLWRTLRLWRPANPESHDRDLMFRRAAAVALVLLLAHSLVDYPLRTTALAAIAAMAAALLVERHNQSMHSPDGSNHR